MHRSALEQELAKRGVDLAHDRRLQRASGKRMIWHKDLGLIDSEDDDDEKKQIDDIDEQFNWHGYVPPPLYMLTKEDLYFADCVDMEKLNEMDDNSFWQNFAVDWFKNQRLNEMCTKYYQFRHNDPRIGDKPHLQLCMTPYTYRITF